jgi:hypothetical protein
MRLARSHRRRIKSDAGELRSLTLQTLSVAVRRQGCPPYLRHPSGQRGLKLQPTRVC